MTPEEFGALTGSEFPRDSSKYGLANIFEEIPSEEEVSQHPPSKDWVADGCVPAPR